MADNTLPPEGLSGEPPVADTSERRAFLRRAVGIGLPVVLATVHGRSVLAQEATLSGCASIAPSGWRARNPTVTDGQCAAVEPQSFDIEQESTGGLLDDLDQEKQRRSENPTSTPVDPK